MEPDFSRVYEENYDQLFKLAYRLTGNKEDAEDVLQEAFLNAYGSYARFENKSQVSTWLYRIVVNCAYKYIKKLKRLPVYDVAPRFNMTKDEFFEKLKTYDSVEDEVMNNYMREECLQLFLKCIPSKQRIAFVLKILLDMSCEEVAQIMDISVGAVKNNVYRARLLMKENMDDKCSYINPNSPCECKNWVAYMVENNKMDMIPKLKLNTEIDYNKIFEKEMSFLSKLMLLYGKYPETENYQCFLVRIKDIVSKKSLKILS